MVDETWKLSYSFDYKHAASIMEGVFHELHLPVAHYTEEDEEYFDVDAGSFTIKLYHNKFRLRTCFGFPRWLKPNDISDMMISPLDDSKVPKVQMILKKFVEKSPKKPWEFGTKVKAHNLGISGRTKKTWGKWLEII